MPQTLVSWERSAVEGVCACVCRVVACVILCRAVLCQAWGRRAV